MKKIFMIVMAMAVFAIALGVSVGTASAASSSVVLYLPGVTQQDLKDASVFVNSEHHDVECTLKDAETGKVVCRVPGKYAGQDVTLYVAGQVFFATVQVPNTPDALPENEPLTCGDGEVLWYSVIWHGANWGTTIHPVWVWEVMEARGSLEHLAEYGITPEIIGTFCAPN